jgi:capsular polysaccharide biosynthesis protein
MTVISVLRYWRLILLVTVAAVGGAIGVTTTTTPLYEARGTYIIGPSDALEQPEAIVRSFDSLQGQGIVPTLVELLSSKSIAETVGRRLDLDPTQVAEFEVRANVLSSSNTLELTVIGPDAEASARLADGVGSDASAVFESLYSVYQIRPLDTPTPPEEAFSPDPVRNVVLGALLGLTLGTGLAFLAGRNRETRPRADRGRRRRRRQTKPTETGPFYYPSVEPSEFEPPVPATLVADSAPDPVSSVVPEPSAEAARPRALRLGAATAKPARSRAGSPQGEQLPSVAVTRLRPPPAARAPLPDRAAAATGAGVPVAASDPLPDGAGAPVEVATEPATRAPAPEPNLPVDPPTHGVRAVDRVPEPVSAAARTTATATGWPRPERAVDREVAMTGAVPRVPVPDRVGVADVAALGTTETVPVPVNAAAPEAVPARGRTPQG